MRGDEFIICGGSYGAPTLSLTVTSRNTYFLKPRETWLTVQKTQHSILGGQKKKKMARLQIFAWGCGLTL